MKKMTLMIKKGQLAEFVKEMRRLKIRHEPFHAIDGEYQITLFPDNNSLLLIMKFGFVDK
jgi:hypothetical protein